MAAEITVQPIRRFPLDAAILFSDILVVPQAMGIDFKMKESVGLWLDTPIRTLEQVENLQVSGAEENLKYVYDAIDITLQKLDNEIPLIGFAGSPWTLLCYCVEGKGSKSFDIAKSFCFTQPEAAHLLCKNYRCYHCLFKEKSTKWCFCGYKFLILGAECFLQKIIKNFLEIH